MGLNATTTIILTAIICVLTYMQWQTSDAMRRLEYARAAAGVRLSVQNGPPVPIKIMQTEVPSTIAVRAEAGVAQVTRVKLQTEFPILVRNYEANTTHECILALDGFYKLAPSGDWVEHGAAAGFSKRLSRIMEEGVLIIMDPTVRFEVTYRDLYGAGKTGVFFAQNGQLVPEAPQYEGWRRVRLIPAILYASSGEAFMSLPKPDAPTLQRPCRELAWRLRGPGYQ